MLSRHPDLLDPDQTCVLAIDPHEALVNRVMQPDRVTDRLRRLAAAAVVLGIPVRISQHDPLPLVPGLADPASSAVRLPTRNILSAALGEDLTGPLRAEGRFRAVIAGVETHAAVQQTVLDLLSQGWRVTLLADATGSRDPLDHEIALRRMEASGATLSTLAAVLAEWAPPRDDTRWPRLADLLNNS